MGTYIIIVVVVVVLSTQLCPTLGDLKDKVLPTVSVSEYTNSVHYSAFFAVKSRCFVHE